MKKATRTMSMIVIAIMAFMLFATSTSAAYSKTDPYGFTWLDEETDIWYFQYYVYNSSEKAYEIKDYAYLKGSTLYDKKGEIIHSKVYEMKAETSKANQPTVAFYKGSLYFITKTGEICKMAKSTETTYAKNTSVSNAKYFTLDADGLATKVSSKTLSSLTFNGTYSRNDSDNESEETKNNYVKTYAYNGDPTKTAYDAYLDGKLLISIYCKNSNVWVETDKLLLSDTCVGAKFVGYTTGFFTIMYDLDGTIYCFPYGNWKTSYPISFNEEIMYYTKDDNGFIKSITTSKGTYNLDALMKAFGYDKYNYTGEDTEVTSVLNSYFKSVAYNKSDEIVATLEKTDSYLCLNEKKITVSTNISYFGFANETPVWIKNSNLYKYTDSGIILIARNVSRLRYDTNGFAYQYVIGNTRYDLT